LTDSNNRARILTAVTEAFVRHESALKRFIARFMRNAADVEDIAQEAFLRAYSAEQGKPIEQPKSFLFRIAKHVALTELSQKSRQITDRIEGFDDLSVVGTEASIEDEVEARQTLGLHCEAVARLPPQCRHVYLLRKVHGMSHKEIAEQLGIAVSTVEKHLIKGVELCDRFLREAAAADGAGSGLSPAVKGRVVGER
jgi:RNA polymerase sigma-70 factor (ECF subfamily)